MNLPPGVFRYLVIGQVFIPIVINFAINLAFGLLTFKGMATVTTWAADKGAAADTIGTCYLLPAITCLICTPLVRRDVRRGAVSPIPLTTAPRWVPYFRGHLIWRSIKFGLFSLATLSGLVAASYWLFAGDTIPTPHFLFIKVASSVAMGIIVTPMIAVVALTDKA